VARIAGVNIPSQKKLGVALTYVYGIGSKFSIDVCKEAKVDWNSRVNDLSESEIKSISDVISSSYMVEGDLRREISANIKRLKDLGTYKGTRHRKNLPARGQRTHTNARTKKGKAIAIAGKKKVTK
jgi:small subunit ribosomal protein S13